MKVTKVEHARKDNPDHDIKKGDTYYWWQFAFGPKMFSKTPPRRSQLTKSEFLSSLYDLQDQIAALTAETVDDLESELETIKDSIQEILDGCQERLDNIPDQLKEASAGELLQERIDALESWISDLDAIDLSFEEDETLSDDKKAEVLQEFVNNAIGEIQETDSGL